MTNPPDGSVVLTGMDEAIIGIASHHRIGQDVLAYDEQTIIRILIERDGMSEEDAQEWFEYNIRGIQEATSPVFVVRTGGN